MKKYQWVALGLAVLVLVMVVLVTIQRPDHKNTASTNETKNPDLSRIQVDTTGWQSYTNEQYGYSFQYPAGWEVVNRNDDPEYVKLKQSYVRPKDVGREYPFGTSILYRNDIGNIDDLKNEVANTTIYPFQESNLNLENKIVPIIQHGDTADGLIQALIVQNQGSYIISFVERGGGMSALEVFLGVVRTFEVK